MKKVNKAVSVAIVVLCLMAPLLFQRAIRAAGSEEASEWTMYRHDVNRSGYTQIAGPKYNFTKWTFQTGHIILSSPAVANGIVYIGSNDSKVYALNMWTGEEIWNFSTGPGGIYSSPAVADGIVYIGANDNKTYALNATTGELIWSFTAWGTLFYGLPSPFWSSPVVVDGIVYIGNQDSLVYALNATTGTVIWVQTVYGACTGSSPTIADGRLYIAAAGYSAPYDGNVTCLNATTGQLIWNYTVPFGVYFSTPTVVNGIVYIGTFGGSVLALNATTGQLMSFFFPGDYYPINTSPAVANGIVYVGSGNGRIYALDASNLAIVKWAKTLSSYGVYSSPIVAGDTVYVGTEDGKIFALDAITGNQIWMYQTGGTIRGSFAVVSGHPDYPCLLYAPAYDGKIYAIYDVFHDIAVTNVSPYKNIVGQGYTMNISVTVENQGDHKETFNVTLYANTTAIETMEVTLESGESTTITFIWNTGGAGGIGVFDKGNYALWVYAWPVLGETDTSDNTFSDGIVYVGIPGDINGDGTVDIYDAILLSTSFGAKQGDPNWNPNADLDNTGEIDIFDAIILSTHFGETDP
ncbi:MAG: PQQ-binding-like beta-propeller repeat protein [Candidatus Bathyarchaeia archaeon]